MSSPTAPGVYGGGCVGCLLPGQNQISARSRTLAPKPITCATPKLPLLHAVQVKKATTATMAIISAKSIFFVDIA
jgi:hypothetical protein